MANVLLTETCVRSCPYCFAKQYMSEGDVDDSLTWDNLIYIADFLESSEEKHISLLGGEPLLHPYIAEFIEYLDQRGFMITVFTSGIMTPGKLEEFTSKIHAHGPELKLIFVVNVNEPRFSPKSEVEKVKKFLEQFGERSSLSFNIYRLDFQMEFLKDYIIDYGLIRRVRLGLAHPIPGSKNLYIKPTDFSQVRNTLMSVFPSMSEIGIIPGFDCGFPMCMFSDDDLGKLHKYTHGQMEFLCGPAIDIGTDLSCWSCFPLSNFHKKSLFDFSNYQEIVQFYGNEMHLTRKEERGIYVECDSCSNYNNNLCSGGCLAHVLNGFIMEGDIR